MTIDADGTRRERSWWSPYWQEHPELDDVTDEVTLVKFRPAKEQVQP